MTPVPPPGRAALAFLDGVRRATPRRTFLQWAGLTLGVSVIGCSDDDPVGPMPGGDDVMLGAGDIGILNYAYALEQLEAAFYTRVVGAPYAGIATDELALLTDIRDHEIVHREFLKAALGAQAIPMLTFDFTSVDFTSRASVLGAARTFEDLGVSAYNGAGALISDAGYLLLAGKIVSVEARHASAIRDLLNPGSADFAGDDVVTPASGLDGAKTPAAVLATAAGFLNETIDASTLPSS